MVVAVARAGEGGREREAGRRRWRMRPGESKVGDDSDGERKGEREGAEYSAAVSRLADSVRSCSECGMSGGRRQEAGANRREEETEGGKKKFENKCAYAKIVHTFFSFFGGGCVCGNARVCALARKVSQAVWRRGGGK